jgi:hypothetical protein
MNDWLDEQEEEETRDEDEFPEAVVTDPVEIGSDSLPSPLVGSLLADGGYGWTAYDLGPASLLEIWAEPGICIDMCASGALDE